MTRTPPSHTEVAIPNRVWFERTFQLGLPVEAFPDILERLRGTPARLEERVRGIAREVLVRRAGPAWSIQENVGHLWDLESLWALRLEQFGRGVDRLQAADLDNRKTHEAGHNLVDMGDLLGKFRRDRMALVERLELLRPAALRRTALHPRLGQPMTVVDHCFFIAEHDDHHLATIGRLIRTGRGASSRDRC